MLGMTPLGWLDGKTSTQTEHTLIWIYVVHRLHKDPFCVLHNMFSWRNKENIYRIQPNYRTVRIGFSKMLGKLVVKYVPTYTKGTLLKKLRKDLSNNAYAMFLYVFFVVFFIKHMLWVLIWIASTSRCNSNGYPQHMPIWRSRQKLHWL